ncbi:MAG: laccase domain-containing protein [Ghiorsea sp.]|nr:laccase domain-containing protein [Ghiorsea sp.]
MAQVNQYQLRRAGILAGNIEVSTHCTACQVNPSYYSYRRDNGKAGRQLSMIMLP